MFKLRASATNKCKCFFLALSGAICPWYCLSIWQHVMWPQLNSPWSFQYTRASENSKWESIGKNTPMALRDELLKSIWHAFTALDVDKSGKVSKSQLKVRFTEYFCETTCYLNISADQRFNSSEFPMNIQITCVFMGIKILKN